MPATGARAGARLSCRRGRRASGRGRRTPVCAAGRAGRGDSLRTLRCRRQGCQGCHIRSAQGASRIPRRWHRGVDRDDRSIWPTSPSSLAGFFFAHSRCGGEPGSAGLRRRRRFHGERGRVCADKVRSHGRTELCLGRSSIRHGKGNWWCGARECPWTAPNGYTRTKCRHRADQADPKQTQAFQGPCRHRRRAHWWDGQRETKTDFQALRGTAST
jgi:hypothetical protein